MKLTTEKESTKLNNMEKTFDELIIEKFSVFGLIKMSFSRNDLIDMMQQVREATIAECVEILTNPNIPKSRMAALKTDRIKTKQ